MNFEVSKKICELKNKLLIGVLLGFFVIICMLLFSDINKMKLLFENIILKYFIYSLIFVIFTYTGRFIKWQLYMKVLNVEIKIKDSFIIFIAGLSMSVTPGRAGEMLKAYLLKKQFDIDFSLTFPTIIAERLSGLIGSTAVLVLSLFFLGKNSQYNYLIFLSSLGIIAFVLLFLHNKMLAQLIFKWLAKINLLKNKLIYIQRMYDSAYVLTSGKIFFLGCFISMIYWCFESMVLANILLSLNIVWDFSTIMMILTLSSIAGGLSMMPASLGVLEIGMIGLLQLEGLDYTTASGITLMHRFMALWLAVIIGITVLIGNVKRFKLIQPDSRKDSA